MIGILYLVSSLRRGGPTSQLLNLVAHLDRGAFEPSVLTLSPEPADSLRDRFEALDIACTSLDLPGGARGLLTARPRLARRLAALSPDIVHTQGIRADLLVATMGIAVPHVATMRNVPHLDYPMTYGAVLGWLMCRVHGYALARAGVVAAVSDAVAYALEDRFGIGKVAIVSNGVDTDRFAPVPADRRRALRRELGLPEEGRVWISVGHLTGRKNPLLIVEAWKARTDLAPDDRLVFLGDGALAEDCRRAAAGRADIVFAGRARDVPAYLGAADGFISASRAEGLPNAVLEAMACGLPLALSDIGPHSEVLAAATGAGRLFAPGDRDGAVAAMAEVERLDRAVVADLARHAATSVFGAAVMSRRYQGLYREMLVAAGPAGEREAPG